MAIIKVISYNPTGVLQESKRSYISELLSKTEAEFIFLQETWLLKTNYALLSKISDKYMFTAVSGFDCESKILHGRPHGGVSIMYTKELADKIDIINTGSSRICAIMFKPSENFKVLMLCIYCPCDNMSRNHTDSEFSECIDQLEYIINGNDCHAVIIGGDLNVDLNRNTAHRDYVKHFVQNNLLKFCWDHKSAISNHSYENHNGIGVSTIDHFICSVNIFDTVSRMHVIDDVTNTSNHRPIILDFECECVRLHVTNQSMRRPRAVWEKASDAHIKRYKDTLDGKLHINKKCLDTLSSCDDKLCRKQEHLLAIEEMCNNVIKSCLAAEQQCIPRSRPKHCKIPFWAEKIKPHRDTAIFWHRLWVDAGRPRDGWVASIRRTTRKKYHQAIKSVRHEETDLRKERMAQQMAENNTRDLWTEIRKLKPSHSVVSTVIDNVSNTAGIATLFGNKYKNLYNSVETEEDDLNAIKMRIHERVAIEGDIIVDGNDVYKAIRKLNRNKSDGNQGFTSDHLINCSDTCIRTIASLINFMLLHGYNPACLSKSFIVFIPKNRQGTLTSSENYRGISLCNAITKVLDLVIISKYQCLMKSCNLQFGFKEAHSTTMCTTIFKEIVTYYRNRGTNVYCCFVDATKAFDRVNIGKLFNLLLSRDTPLPALVLRLLFDMYTRQIVYAKWQNAVSEPFSVTNGVRQGAVLSPILFCLYIDVLINRLVSSGIGCHITDMYYGVLGYADDLVLLSPSRDGLQKMLTICENYGKEYDMNFHPKKTVCMYMSNNVCTSDIAPLKLSGHELKWVQKFEYLGIDITPDLKDCTDIKRKRGKFIGNVNSLLSCFYNLPCTLLNRLFDSYCTSFYGCQTWSLKNSNLKQLGTAYNKALRRIWKLPNTSHTNIVMYVASKSKLLEVLERRFCKMYFSMLNSSNPYIKCIAEHGQQDMTSLIGVNLDAICKHHGLYTKGVNDWFIKSILPKTIIGSENTVFNQVVKELCLCRENTLDLSFTNEDIQLLIDWLSTI